MARAVRRERTEARWLLVLAASVGLHVVVFGALWAARPAPPPSAPKPPVTQVQLRWLSADDVTTTPVASTPPVERPTRGGASRGAAQAPSVVTDSGAVTVVVEGAPDGDVAGGLAVDRPLSGAGVLAPGLGAVLRLPPAGDAEPSHGATLRNHPSERVDDVALAEYTGEVLSRKLGEQLRADVGAAAAGVGSAPPYFKRLESGLRDTFWTQAVDHGPLDDAAHAARSILSHDVSPEAAQRVTDSALGRAAQSGIGAGASMDERASREAMLQMMGAVEGLKERLAAPRLRIVLQLTTDPSGAVADVTVLEKSGDVRFDESVMHLTRKGARRLYEDDERGLGASWWRTRWQYTLEPPGVRVKLLDAVRLAPSP